MARVFIDGFEAGDAKLWENVSGATVSAASTYGMDGSYCIYMAEYQYITKTLPSASEYYLAFIYRPTNTNNTLNIMQYFSGATQIAMLTRNVSTYVLEARRGAGGGTLLASSATTLIVNTNYLIEVRYKPADSGGVFQVKINGALEINFSGDTTDGATTIDSLRFGCSPNSTWGWMAYDNIIVDDAAWIGNTRIQAIVPTGAGNSAQLTPSTGNNWACVDEKPPSETDYVSTNVVDQLDTYAAGDLAGTIGTVKCVQVQTLAKAEGAPTPTNFKLAVRVGGTDYLSTNKPPLTISKQLYAVWETNPNTAAAWTEAGVNGMEFGVKSAA